MNFTGTREGTEKKVELKYCERCGGLFLRAPGAGVVYCEGCASCVAAHPDLETVLHSGPQKKSRGARVASGLSRPRHLQASDQIESLRGVESGEARA
jgi:hypothetical protein